MPADTEAVALVRVEAGSGRGRPLQTAAQTASVAAAIPTAAAKGEGHRPRGPCVGRGGRGGGRLERVPCAWHARGLVLDLKRHGGAAIVAESARSVGAVRQWTRAWVGRTTRGGHGVGHGGAGRWIRPMAAVHGCLYMHREGTTRGSCRNGGTERAGELAPQGRDVGRGAAEGPPPERVMGADAVSIEPACVEPGYVEVTNARTRPAHRAAAHNARLSRWVARFCRVAHGGM
mmetsp:Transcript_14302/g.37566  ORF Transcript_14302/g.37566 Transcript_14302/m.37566 type:complete len:232 (+) Transcript_14302:757-1452(+)